MYPLKRFSFIVRLLETCILLLLGGLFMSPPLQLQAAATPPTLLSPASGTTTNVGNHPPLGIPEVEWSSVAGTTRYRLQFSQDIGFAAVQLEVTTPNTKWTPTNAGTFSDGTWYWRVRVDAPSASNYSSTFFFIKQWASPSNLPSLVSPADGATISFYDSPVFTWQSVTGAAYYRVQMATSSNGFNSPVYNVTTLAPTHQPVNKLANGTYYWRIVPVDTANRDGTPSLVRSFTTYYDQIPTLLTPANSSTPTFTPTFSWTAVRGAQYYRLQYSTDPTFNAALSQVDTNNTFFTPTGALSNDVNYYWRVRAFSGNSVGDWSSTFTFIKQWYLKPTLLTPTNLYQYTSEPFFSWTPVLGASRYQIEVSTSPNFAPLNLSEISVNTYYVRPSFPWESNPSFWYWRVTPIDGSGNAGKASNVSSFIYSSSGGWSPRQLFPFYYYTPTATLNPHEDPTIPLPVFMWHRILTVTTPLTQVAAYRLQVSLATDPFLTSPIWTFDTENLSATPSLANNFTPSVGGNYLWRVGALDSVGGNQIGQWSQIWKTRIDTTKMLTPTLGITPTLLRPAHGSEFVETAPMLEWWPTQGASSYRVQISASSSFSSTLVDATVPYPVFTPQTHLGYGTYYWRVCASSCNNPPTNYSAVWRFQVAAQSRWQEPRSLGSASQLQIGSDPVGDMTNSSYDLRTLTAAQSQNYWYFGFNVNGSADVYYGLYLDLDHVDNSGAPNDAMGLNVSTIPAHQPEYAIYVSRQGATFSADNVFVYGWSTGAGKPSGVIRKPNVWNPIGTLSSIGGGLYYSPTVNYVELQLPNTAIGMQETTGSASVELFSAMVSGGHAQDTVPSDPNVAYTVPAADTNTTMLSRFSSVSEHLTLTTPPTSLTGDPADFASVPPFLWQSPLESSSCGYQIQFDRDAQYTSLVLDYAVACSSLIPPDYTNNGGDLWGDNTYYWRVRPIYTNGSRGSWSSTTAFDRQGFVTRNLTESVTFATPTFSWDMVEGADHYDLQVDTNTQFNSIQISNSTTQNTFTPTGTLANGTYYWRVRVARSGGLANAWSEPRAFTLNLPQPTGLMPSGGTTVNRAPTFCWTPLSQSVGGIAVLTAWRYRFQSSRTDPTFSSPYETVETEQACWTPQASYDDGNYYWRVAMFDGQGRMSSYTPAAQFTKQYPVTALVSPLTGSYVVGTPTYVWTPVDGAAVYRLQVSAVNTFAPIDEEVTTNNVRYMPPRIYTYPSTYFWRVAIIDQNGKPGPFNTATILPGAGPYRLNLPLILR